MNEWKITFKDFKVQAEQALPEKETCVKSLTEHVLKTKGWTMVLGEDITENGNLKQKIK